MSNHDVQKLGLYMAARAQTLQAWGWSSTSIAEHLDVPVTAVEDALREPDPLNHDYESDDV